MTKKTRLPAILLNYDFYTKPRNRAWIKKHGADAVIILQTVWIAASQEAGCKIKKQEVHGIAYPINIDDDRITEVLNSAIEVGLLDSDQDHFFNSQILEDFQAFEIKRQNYSKARQNRPRNHLESSEDSPIILPETSENDTDTEHCILNTDIESNNLKNSKQKKYKTFLESDFKFPEKWGTQSKEYLKRWIEFKAASGNAKLLVSYQSEIDLYADKPREFARLVDRAITNGWKGLNAQISFDTQANGYQQKKSNAETAIEVHQRIVKMEEDYEANRIIGGDNKSLFVLPES